MPNTGKQQYWIDGEPVEGGATSTTNTGKQQYWIDGEPMKAKNNTPAAGGAKPFKAFIIG